MKMKVRGWDAASAVVFPPTLFFLKHGGWGAIISLVCLPLAYPVAWLMVIQSNVCTQQQTPPKEESRNRDDVENAGDILRHRAGHGYQPLVL